jgi:hypothetical protein
MHSAAVRAQAMELVHAGLNDCEVARRTGVARTTIRDWRKPRYQRKTPAGERGTCPRCWTDGPLMKFSREDYAELLGLYLGDGYIVRLARTHQLRIFLDSRYGEIVTDTRSLLERCFRHQAVGTVLRHHGRMTVLRVHSRHLPCLLPQHGSGMKHQRPIILEDWQQAMVSEAPWHLLKGLIRSDGCSFINRTGPYEYLSYSFSNHSTDILDLFCRTCDQVGLQYRRYARAVRINRRSSVSRLRAEIGVKR